jgi:hypothetical protein
MGRGRKDWHYYLYALYYNKDGDVCLMMLLPETPEAKSFEELRAHMNRMLSAFGKPVLDYDKIKFGSMDEDGDNISNGVDWNMCDDTYIGIPDWDIKNYDGHVKGTRCT